MATKQLRTVKKSSDTGRLNRAAVRAAVIEVRDSRTANASRLHGRQQDGAAAGKHARRGHVEQSA